MQHGVVWGMGSGGGSHPPCEGGISWFNQFGEHVGTAPRKAEHEHALQPNSSGHFPHCLTRQGEGVCGSTICKSQKE